MLISFIEPFGVLFWILLGISTVVMVCWTEIDKEGDSIGPMTWTFFLSFAIFLLFTNIDKNQFNLEYFKDNINRFLLYTGGYILGGSFWAICKWWIFQRKKLKKYNELKQSWLRDKHVDVVTIPDNLKNEWHSKLEREYGHNYVESIKPPVWKNKALIMSWLIYWPWSIIGFVVADALKTVFEFTFDLVKSFLQKISDYVFRSVQDELKKPPKI